MQPFNMLIKSSDTRTTFYCRQFQFTNYNLKSAITNTRPGPNILIHMYMPRQPNWETTTKSNLGSGPTSGSIYSKLPAAKTRSMPQNLLQRRNSSADGVSERQEQEASTSGATAKLPMTSSKVPSPVSQDPCPVSHILRLAGRQGQADYLFMQHL